jgi:FlaA1/EpsC-like NDP-sugar epimerase
MIKSQISTAIASRIVALPRRSKRAVMLAADLVAMPACLGLSLALSLVSFDSVLWVTPWPWAASTAVAVYSFRSFGLYRSIVRFMGLDLIVGVFKSVTITAVVLAMTVFFLESGLVALKVGAVFWLAAVVYLSGSRIAVRLFLQKGRLIGDRVIIYGAGDAGVQLVSAIARGGRFTPVAFIDDSPSLTGTVINGLEVYPPDDLPALIESLGVARVLLALPSISRRRRRRIIDQLEDIPVHVQTMPDIGDLISGSARVDEIGEVDVADLLGRVAVPSVDGLLDACIRGKSVMVTGAGGSIGSELCRQIGRLGPKRLIILDLSEAALYTIDQKLREMARHENLEFEIVPLIGSVHHKNRMMDALRAYSVNTVYHTAAYKHVPLVEHNMIEGIHNNIFGTLHSAEAAIESGVESFVLVSTDKAVLPTNVMGATKRFAELVLQGLNTRGKNTTFSMVRFGNVLASSGSVVPLFRQQIRDGGPVTVTHPEIYRYFMTIPEAAQLVIQAGSMATGGDVFVLDMGKPVRIVDLAEKMIHLMGLTVRDEDNADGDIEIEYTGLRPAEKLYEELLIGNNVMGTDHPSIMRAEEDFLRWEELEGLLDRLWNSCQRLDCEQARELLLIGVTGYTPTAELADLVWCENYDKNQDGESSATVTTLQPKQATVQGDRA